MKNRLKVARAEADLTPTDDKRCGVRTICAFNGLGLEDGTGVWETRGGDFHAGRDGLIFSHAEYAEF